MSKAQKRAIKVCLRIKDKINSNTGRTKPSRWFIRGPKQLDFRQLGTRTTQFHYYSVLVKFCYKSMQSMENSVQKYFISTSMHIMFSQGSQRLSQIKFAPKTLNYEVSVLKKSLKCAVPINDQFCFLFQQCSTQRYSQFYHKQFINYIVTFLKR